MDVEPFGGVQDDLRAGVVGSIVAAASGAKVKPSDLFPSLAEPKAAKPARGMDYWKAQARAIARLTRGQRG